MAEKRIKVTEKQAEKLLELGQVAQATLRDAQAAQRALSDVLGLVADFYGVEARHIQRLDDETGEIVLVEPDTPAPPTQLRAVRGTRGSGKRGRDDAQPPTSPARAPVPA